MKRFHIILVFLLFLVTPLCFCQYDNDDFSITVVDENPKFENGDMSNFFVWIYKNITYPKTAIRDSISGRTIHRFMVDSSGVVKNVVILRSARSDLDNAAKDIIELSPRWTPAQQLNKNIGISFVIPVDYDINDPYFINQIRKNQNRATK
jgi:TonB family protein